MRFEASPACSRASSRFCSAAANVPSSVVVSPAVPPSRVTATHGARVHIHGVLFFVRKMRAAVLHLRDLRLGVERIVPIRVRPLLLALAIHTRQIFTRRRFDARRLGQVGEKLLVAAPVVAPHDRLHRRVRFQRRPVHTEGLASNESRAVQHAQNPAKNRLVRFQVEQSPCSRNR